MNCVLEARTRREFWKEEIRMTTELTERNRRAAEYRTRVRRRVREERRKDRAVRRLLAAAVVFLLWVVSLALIVKL